MGTRMAPAYANLSMGEFERKALKDYADQPFLWLRYIDDILMVWTHGEEKLHNFITYLNNIHPTIKFTSERSITSIPFLDVNIQLENRKIDTDLYCKRTDKHQYLLHSSSHPYHTKKAIPYSLALRLRRICSKDEFFEHRSAELLSYLTKRGYKDRFVKQQILREPNRYPEVRHYRNIIMIKINPTPQSPSRSLIPHHYLIFKKYFTGNNLFSTPQIAFKKYSKINHLSLTVVHQTFATFWFEQN